MEIETYKQEQLHKAICAFAESLDEIFGKELSMKSFSSDDCSRLEKQITVAYEATGGMTDEEKSDQYFEGNGIESHPSAYS